jgi:hypothetical protein
VAVSRAVHGAQAIYRPRGRFSAVLVVPPGEPYITWIERSSEGVLLATSSFRIEAWEHEERRVTVLWPEYGYVAPERRQSWHSALSFLHACVAARLWSPGRPLYMFVIGYLPSYLAIQEGIDLWLHDGAGMTAWERRLRERLSARVVGWEPETGNVHMPTIPLDCREAWPRRPSSRLAAQRYVAQNPRWREGIAAVMFARLDATVISRCAQVVLRRRAQRR